MVSVLIRQIKYICILYIVRNKLVNDIFLYLYGITNAQSAVSKKIQKKKTKNKTNPILCWCENISYSHSFKLFSERCVLGCVCVCVYICAMRPLHRRGDIFKCPNHIRSCLFLIPILMGAVFTEKKKTNKSRSTIATSVSPPSFTIYTLSIFVPFVLPTISSTKWFGSRTTARISYYKT